MIIRELHGMTPSGVRLYRTYSDAGMKIEQNTGRIYDEAIDVEDSEYTYMETEIPIEDEVDDSEALEILLGGAT